MAVLLDVVYNHMGPEGNYLNDFGPYFTDKYNTPWGKALNFDDAYCDGVRNFFLQNALMWLRDFRLDGLRLDAIHAIKDMSAKHFLRELSEATQALGEKNNREFVLIGECDLNDTKYIDNYEQGGYGLTGQWIDEFHHAIHALMTGEQSGYYEDFGELHHLAKAFQKTFVYDGLYSPHRHRIFGNSAENNPYSQFVVFSQNHDQVGNRMLGERLTSLVSFEALKLIAGAVILSPSVPMLFMGEEYGERKSFPVFCEPYRPATRRSSEERQEKRSLLLFRKKEKLRPIRNRKKLLMLPSFRGNLKGEKHAILLDFYKKLIHIRKTIPAFQSFERKNTEVSTQEKSIIILHRKPEGDQKQYICIMNFGKETSEFNLTSTGKTYLKNIRFFRRKMAWQRHKSSCGFVGRKCWWKNQR